MHQRRDREGLCAATPPAAPSTVAAPPVCHSLDRAVLGRPWSAPPRDRGRRQTPTATRKQLAMEDAHGDHDSRLIRDLCALLATVMAPASAPPPARVLPRGGMSAAGAASMLLGASMALMLCGSVTFAIGFLLMPWVAGVALLFGFAGVVSTLSSGLLPSPPSFSKGQSLTSLPPSPQGRIGSARLVSASPEKLVAWR